jgi:proteasome accessory factor A
MVSEPLKNRLFGIETEYGISVEGCTASDLVMEAMHTVRAFRGAHCTGWNYRGEDPRRDMRGFSAERLAVDPQDAQFDAPGASAHTSAEERSDRILSNGARLYNDHGHPEYATPECCTLQDLTAHDKAGEDIVLQCARHRAEALQREVRLYKNNTDFHGASYGTHESYLMRRDVPPQSVIDGLLPFFVTRQLFAGAGKVGAENGGSAVYQLSQRADFFSVNASVDTLHNRPIVNTRDEPHAASASYRRLHVIVGDANMSEWATWMKVGTTSLVLGLLETGWMPKLRPADPVWAIRHLSRDIDLDWVLPLESGRKESALEIQREYLAEAECRMRGLSPELDSVLAEWRLVLDQLEKDITLVKDRVDWVTKRLLLEEYQDAAGIDWRNPALQSLDLAYHDLDPEIGLYRGLEQAGEVRRMVPAEDVHKAETLPPSDTRAAIRGAFVRRFSPSVIRIGWNGVMFRTQQGEFLFDMNTLTEPSVRTIAQELERCASIEQVVKMLQSNGAEAP